ncbi:large conductance mechanosensitive channel protein MscL [Pseudooceanicola sp. CBS1P-1]|uniref:Large-conductance mechanosensitive channel n=1 Tax=Pseudooceanicola albus TaxID=2692189 RepID=A0A6L7G8N8_9RHOB|nr:MULTISPECIES: large conductance mechanosensitive channel protein MscL [Pseudooceanicola]MBT9386407.1 large conductance mechanosensitive channel protein MscL [Pseudooceanicola endophyticus]MXN20435.1 large conductance mechanosensitive channel protein MscL [Pseudooceanicola albus]
MLKEFRAFIAKGNVLDMAVGIIIGAAFTAIVKSMVSDLLNPILGLLTGGLDFSNHYLLLAGQGPYDSLAAARDAGAVVFAYGAFLSAVINFLLVAFVVFLLVRYVNRLKDRVIREEAAAPAEEKPAGPTQLDVLLEIRDVLKKDPAA